MSKWLIPFHEVDDIIYGDAAQMMNGHQTVNPANEVQLLESPLYIAQYAQVGKIGKAATLRM